MATSSGEAELQSMGFDKVRVREALRVCEGNMERAINYLLEYNDSADSPPLWRAASGTAGAVSSASTLSLPRMVVAHGVSQYSFDNGRSACTCIALRAASSFLEKPVVEDLTAAFLQRVMQEGVIIHAEMFVGQSSSSSEHASAEEALEKDRNSLHFRHLRVAGGIQQGLLHKNPKHPQGLLTLLMNCRKDLKLNEWMAVVFTKSPESIALFLPPEGSSLPFVLFDSHPRPMLDADGAYVQFHISWESLFHTLLTIFPPTNLGRDVADWMEMAYNSFDLYPLVRASSHP